MSTFKIPRTDERFLNTTPQEMFLDTQAILAMEDKSRMAKLFATKEPVVSNLETFEKETDKTKSVLANKPISEVVNIEDLDSLKELDAILDGAE